MGSVPEICWHIRVSRGHTDKDISISHRDVVQQDVVLV
jgi:hypothetical protein